MTSPHTAQSISDWRVNNPGQQLDLRGANLSGAYLGYANLRGAKLGGANLSDADLSDADLSDANLFGANLSRAYLGYADLRGANLFGADLFGANLGGAKLGGADLRYANLRAAHLGDNRILQVGPVGSRRAQVVLMAGPELDDVRTGCFHGTLSEFETEVQKTHGDNKYGWEYRAIIALFRGPLTGATKKCGICGEEV